MAGIPHDHYKPKTGMQKWFHERLPIASLIYDTLTIPTPKNLNWMWIWGIVLTFCLALQIITGIILVMHYTPHVDLAFDSVEHIMRDVNGGWAFRYLHANGASLFFIAVYAHIFRGLFYGSYKAPREITWILGMLIYLMMMATGFLGYVLPWGQMSFWGATVITGLFGAIPGVGGILQEWLLGGPAVDNATLNRFFSLHYLLPFVIVGLVALHIWAFHTTGNNNPTGVEVRRKSKAEAQKDTVPFWPYYVIKDLFALVMILIVFMAIVGFMPNYLGHPDNYIPANPLATPAHIVPEWYYLPFYAILRAITFDVLFLDAKFLGVLAMFGSIAVMALAPWTDTSPVRSGRYRPTFKIAFWVLGFDFMLLMWCGAQPAEGLVPLVSLIGAIYWFAYFLIILPVLGWTEKTLPVPETIEADFDAHYPPKPSTVK
ncbi:cytochrome b N-terminal domain-containing protein [Amylibacter sp.]|jgi:ubiquinol-cytochrome c reductase cytochrome b subunit|nr:Cytochrome b [alpha proteobacterium HTCC2255] [Rhodobacterales bacterium HTCC2255]MBT3952893.1 cytochrome b [Rhodobacterales bacterium]MDA7738339.1 cytochrome b N-terminal domain-containing protein [Amylibacter sp.]MBT4133278.1 cytochrome b [Rhodobacterales bacterium]MBT4322721.1 cytochrome b [Rhodobacterales bacterium]|tara:strand:- start:1283 stop:2572 length:1290 start_codon:yes stop_codon:yes gene_type:complete